VPGRPGRAPGRRRHRRARRRRPSGRTRMSAPLRRSPRAARPPARIVHLGLGAFARAHAAVYTEHAPGDEWGIAGFTGRRAAAAQRLSAQDGLYHVLTRAADGDSAELITA